MGSRIWSSVARWKQDDIHLWSAVAFAGRMSFSIVRRQNSTRRASRITAGRLGACTTVSRPIWRSRTVSGWAADTVGPVQTMSHGTAKVRSSANVLLQRKTGRSDRSAKSSPVLLRRGPTATGNRKDITSNREASIYNNLKTGSATRLSQISRKSQTTQGISSSGSIGDCTKAFDAGSPPVICIETIICRPSSSRPDDL